jgi:hypothetical protein
MFDFFSMMGTYDQRKVDNFTQGDLVIDTCCVTDSRQPYETAVQHPGYNDGDWVIVETYSTKEAAQEGHNRWVKVMTSTSLPAVLKDVSTAEIAELARAFGVDLDCSLYYRK